MQTMMEPEEALAVVATLRAYYPAWKPSERDISLWMKVLMPYGAEVVNYAIEDLCRSNTTLFPPPLPHIKARVIGLTRSMRPALPTPEDTEPDADPEMVKKMVRQVQETLSRVDKSEKEKEEAKNTRLSERLLYGRELTDGERDTEGHNIGVALRELKKQGLKRKESGIDGEEEMEGGRYPRDHK